MTRYLAGLNFTGNLQLLRCRQLPPIATLEQMSGPFTAELPFKSSSTSNCHADDLSPSAIQFDYCVVALCLGALWLNDGPYASIWRYVTDLARPTRKCVPHIREALSAVRIKARAHLPGILSLSVPTTHPKLLPHNDRYPSPHHPPARLRRLRCPRRERQTRCPHLPPCQRTQLPAQDPRVKGTDSLDHQPDQRRLQLQLVRRRHHQVFGAFPFTWAGITGNHLTFRDLQGTWKSVTGTFTVPTPSGSGSASAWVGIDGDTCGTAILQTGIDFTVSGGSVSYDCVF